MTTKFYKKISNESGEFTTTNKNVSWTTMTDMPVNLNMSYIDLTLNLKDTAGVVLKNSDVSMGDVLTLAGYPSSSIVRNVKLSCDSKGDLEEVREQNRLSSTLANYMDTEDVKKSKAELHRGYSIRTDGNGDCHLQIPCKDLMLGCASNGVHLSGLGDLTLAVELEDTKPVFNIISLANNSRFKHTALVANTEYKQITTTTRYDTEAGALAIFKSGSKWLIGSVGAVIEIEVDSITYNTAPKTVTLNLKKSIKPSAAIANTVLAVNKLSAEVDASFPNIGGAAFDDDTLTTSDNHVPADFVVGAKYYVGFYDDTGSEQLLFTKTIQSVAANAVDASKVDITFTSAIQIPAGASNGYIVKIDDVINWTVKKAEMVIAKSSVQSQNPAEIETYNTESMTLSDAVDEYRNQVMLPNAVDKVMIHLETSSALLGVSSNVNQYRFTRDGVDTSNRDLVYSGERADTHEVKLMEVIQPKTFDTDAWLACENVEDCSMLDFTLKGNQIPAGRVHVFKKFVKAF